MATTTRLGIQLLEVAQSGKEVTVNQALTALDNAALVTLANTFAAAQTISLSDAVTGAVSYMLVLSRNTSGTPGAGFAGGLQVTGMNGSRATVEWGTLRWSLATLTAGAEDVNVTFGIKRAGTTTDHTRLFAAGGMAVLGGGISLGTGAAPTAKLHLAAGAAAANSAPVKYTAGTNLTVPETGAVEFDGDRWLATPRTTRRNLSLNSDAATAAVTVVNTLTETALGTATFAANELSAGRVIRIRLMGVYSSANATDTFTIRARFNSTTGASLGPVVSSTGQTLTNASFDLELVVSVRSTGASGAFIAGWGGNIFQTVKTNHSTAAGTVDTTVAENILITVTWSNALAGNTITVHQFYVEALG